MRSENLLRSRLMPSSSLARTSPTAGASLDTIATRTTSVDPDTGPEHRALPSLLAHSVVPIIVGYMTAHYLSYFVEYGQTTLVQTLFGKTYDRNGVIAAKGRVLEPVLERMLRNTYFSLKPPRSAGREEFGREYSAKFLSACRKVSREPEDAVATATALTAESIARSFEQFVWPSMEGTPIDYVVSGGGAKNSMLVSMLSKSLAPFGCALTTTERFGMPAEAKEAAAFALLAWATWNRLPGNVPSATGAKRFAVLGQIAFS